LAYTPTAVRIIRLWEVFFIQTNDLFGVHTDDESTLGKRISFGIIAKYAITGLKLEEKNNNGNKKNLQNQCLWRF
jgi:hypothetical protein